VIRLGEPEPEATLHSFGGSASDKFNNALIKGTADTGWFPSGQSEEIATSRSSSRPPACRRSSQPTKGMLTAQAMAAHNAAMECSRRAMLREQPFEVAQGFRNTGPQVISAAPVQIWTA
jgi:hypothetical protein